MSSSGIQAISFHFENIFIRPDVEQKFRLAMQEI